MTPEDVGTWREFQRLVADLDYPLFIVTVAADGERSGCLIGFATQCSIDPPRYWACISKTNHTWKVAVRAQTLVVHVPSPDERGLVELFGETTGDDIDKFSRVPWEPGPDGVTPLLSGCTRWFAGRVIQQVDSGDHTSFLIEPFAASSGSEKGQLGFQEAKDLEPGHAP
ncbi:MAG: flavin reductase [Actinobacteria bacterium]|nr:flavin reductase [Actinomycetota bacterium]